SFRGGHGIRDRTVTGVQTCALPILSRSMNGVAEIATRKLARLQQDSFAARPMVKLRSTGTLFASVTARLATIDPLLAGKTMAMRSEERRVGKDGGGGEGRRPATEQF